MKNKLIEGKLYANEFRQTFGKSLADYFSPLFGFNIVAFDENINTPDGISTKDFIKKKWGEKAMQLIKKLISM